MKTHITLLMVVFGANAFQLQTNVQLRNCVQNTMRKLFAKDETLIYVHTGDTDPFPPTETNPHVVVDIRNRSLAVRGYKHYKHNYVIHAKSFKTVKDLLVGMVKSKVWHDVLSFYGTFFLITTVQKLAGIFETFWGVGIVNVIVMVYGPSGDATVITSDPQAVENECGLKLKSFLTRTDCRSSKPINLPKTLRKFSNCNLMYVSGHANLRKGFKEVEAAWLVLNAFSTHWNVSNVTAVNPNHNNPQYNLFTFKSLYVATLDDNSTTRPYYTEDIVWIVPPPKRIPTIETLRLILKGNVWLLVGVSFIATSLTWWLIGKQLQRSLDFGKVLLRVFSVTLFGSAHKYEKIWAIRYLFIAYVLYSIHIQTAFTSKLTEVLTVPQYEPKIKTVQELAASNITVLVRQDLYNIYFGHEESHNTLYNSIKHKLEKLDGDSMADAAVNSQTYEKYGLLVQKNYMDIAKKILQIQPVTIEENTLLGKLGHVFAGLENGYVLRIIDKVISMLEESGIHENHLKGVIFKNAKRIMDVEKTVLTLNHLLFMFIIWIAGLSFASLVFVVEVLWDYKKRLSSELKKSISG